MKTRLILVLSIAITSIVLAAAEVPGNPGAQAVLDIPTQSETPIEQPSQEQQPSLSVIEHDSNPDTEGKYKDEPTVDDDPALRYVIDPSKKGMRGYDVDGRQEIVNTGPGMKTTIDGQIQSRSGPRGRQRGVALPNKYIVRLKYGTDPSAFDIHSRAAEHNRLIRLSPPQQDQMDQDGKEKVEQQIVPNQVDHEYDFGTWKGYAGQFSSEFVKELQSHDEVEYVEEDRLMWAWGVDDAHRQHDVDYDEEKHDGSEQALTGIDQTGIDQALNAAQDPSYMPPASNEPAESSDFGASAIINGRNVPVQYYSLKAPSWGLTRISERENDLQRDYSYMSSAGDGVDVYIIDSGVYAEHSDFGGRAFNLVNFVPDEGDTDNCGHGTHVAGIVAGRRYGVAKAARIQAIKVLDSEGQGSTSQVMAGINYMIKHASRNPNQRKVINMSLGGQFSRPVNEAVHTAVTQYGLPFFVAAGNTGDDACQYSPAGVAEAFAVGGSDRYDRVGWYSCVGSCVSLFAPGSGIVSDWIRTPTAAHILDGTSMASPHVAGVAALFLGAGNTYSNPQELYKDLIGHSTQGVINGLQTFDQKTSRNLLYNKLEDLTAQAAVTPQDDLEALEKPLTPKDKTHKKEKPKKVRDDKDHHAVNHHHH
ncbi:subtilisin-like serine protease [Mortierella sp. GBA30]|nr:subtilisin-like serine protease [Mortierella sp. GBA30]